MSRTSPALFVLSGVDLPGCYEPSDLDQRLDPEAINDFSDVPVIRNTQSGSAVVRAQILLGRAHFLRERLTAPPGQFSSCRQGFQKAHGIP